MKLEREIERQRQRVHTSTAPPPQPTYANANNRKKRQYVSIVTSDEWEAFLSQKHEESAKVKRGWVGQR